MDEKASELPPTGQIDFAREKILIGPFYPFSGRLFNVSIFMPPQIKIFHWCDFPDSPTMPPGASKSAVVCWIKPPNPKRIRRGSHWLRPIYVTFVMEDGRVDVLRTAIVLVLLMALGYGVWVVLDHDDSVEDPPVDWEISGPLAEGEEGDRPFAPPPNGGVAQGGVAQGGVAQGGAAQGASLGSPAGYAQTPSSDDSSTNDSATTSGYAADSSPAYANQVTTPTAESSFPPPPPGFGGETASDSAAGFGAENGSTLPEPALPDPALAEHGHSHPDHGAPSVYGADTSKAAIPNEHSASPTAVATEEPAATSAAPASTFQVAVETAQRQIKEEQPYDALYTLSLIFGDPGLSADESRTLYGMLDPLAGKVIYSKEHLLEPGYQVQRGEDLFAIAKRMHVPHQLLQNINGIKDPTLLRAGSTLKVVQGPFRAEVDLSSNELILFLGKLYAGRFPISVGNEPAPRPGEFEVRGKETGKAYYGPSGATFEVNHPNNPYGRHWLDLGSQFCIHGTSSIGENHAMGCVSLSPVDAGDVFGILSVGSRVLFRR